MGYEVYVNTFGMQLRTKVSTQPINHSKSGIVWHQHAQGRAPFQLTAILQVNIRCNSNQGITVDVDRFLYRYPGIFAQVYEAVGSLVVLFCFRNFGKTTCVLFEPFRVAVQLSLVLCLNDIVDGVLNSNKVSTL